MRTKAVFKLIAPYTRFNLAFIGKVLKIPVLEVQDILGFLIVDNKVNGKINQQDGTVEIQDNRDKERLRAMQEWTDALGSLYRTVFADGEGFKPPERSADGFDMGGLGMLAGGGDPRETLVGGFNKKARGRGKKW